MEPSADALPVAKRARTAPGQRRFPIGDTLVTILSFCEAEHLLGVARNVCRGWREAISKDPHAWPRMVVLFSKPSLALSLMPRVLSRCDRLSLFSGGSIPSGTLPQFPRVRRMTVDCDPTGIEETLAACPSATALYLVQSLPRVFAGVDMLAYLLGRTQLRSLRLKCDCAFDVVPALPSAPHIEALHIRWVNQCSLDLIRACPNLCRLYIRSDFDRPSLADLCLYKLELLEIDGYNTGTLGFIERLPSLAHLSVKYEPLLEEAITRIGKGLKTLHLHGTLADEVYTRILGATGGLEELSVEPVTGEGVRTVAASLPPTLRRLRIKQFFMDRDTASAIVRRCPLLENLQFLAKMDDPIRGALSELGRNLVTVDVLDFGTANLSALAESCPRLEMIRALCGPVREARGLVGRWASGCYALCRAHKVAGARADWYIPSNHSLFARFEDEGAR